MAGRPSKYDPAFCEELIAHMREGYTLESFAGRIGVHRDTLYAWRDANQEFSDAIKIGKDAAQYKWETALHDAVVDPKGMNATPILFALKCRFGYKEVQAVEHSGPDGKPIETKNVSDLPDDKLDARIAALIATKEQVGNSTDE